MAVYDGEKVWVLEGELAVESGAELMAKLEEYGMGRAKLAIGYAKFPKDDDGNITQDVEAEKIAKEYFKRPRFENGTFDGRYFLCDVGRQMVKDICEKGFWEPEKPVKVALKDQLASVKKIEKKKKAKVEVEADAKGDPKAKAK